VSEKNTIGFTERKHAPMLPMGLRFGIVDEICIIDFIDIPDNNVGNVFSSIAITKKQAKNLIENLNNFIGDENTSGN